MRKPYTYLLNYFRFQYRFINNFGAIKCDDIKNDYISTSPSQKSVYSPVVSETALKKINSVVGIQTGLSYVSWARIEKEQNNVTHLNYLSLPEEMFKMELHQIYSVRYYLFQAYNLSSTLPSADCYVMENLPKIISGTGGKLQLTLQATRMQFIAMIVAMLNQNQDGEQIRVLFMKPRTSAKLFQLLVGSEVTSSQGIVSKILSDDNLEPFSPLKCAPEIVLEYNRVSRVDKEILGQALLLTMSFMELILFRNEHCFRILSNSKKK